MIGPRREWRKGWAVQSVRLLKRDMNGYDSYRRRCRQDRCSVVVHQRGYVKLWRKIGDEWQVVDRALSQRRAMRRARQILEQEARHGS